MPKDKYKNIPTLDVPVLDDVVSHGNKKTKAYVQTTVADKAKKPAAKKKAKRNSNERRADDRRKKQPQIPHGKTDQRMTQRRKSARRGDDKQINETLDVLAEKIMQDMMPDLEQHLFMQLRFELQKYLPKILNEFKDKDDE